MAISNRESQAAYRERMYAAGYKQARIWVPRKSEGRAVKMTRKTFISNMDALTAGWSNARLSKIYNEFIKVIINENKKGKVKKK
ncbi:MAG: hypothetical protein Pg6A_01360 [Termitinemataceae bacterium]|jgi:hypothetical protein|nr:MAG: hypothetical protein Pg6A_01360 [Termitinemataceae bacterium]